MKLKCIAIDDEPRALDVIKMHSRKVDFIELVHTFRDPLKALSYLNQNPIDLIFLDINMPDLNGIDFLKTLTSKPMVIFTTAYSEYAVESYEFEAMDYLLKPILFPRFIKAVNKAFDFYKLNNQESNSISEQDEPTHILIKSGNEMERIDFKDLLYIEGARNYIFFHTSEKRIMSLMRMKEAEKELPSGIFIQVHKSYIISKNFIEKVERHQVTVAGKQIPIGNTYRNEFQKSLENR